SKLVGYLVAKDLLSQSPSSEWTSLIRKVPVIRPSDSVATALFRFQQESTTRCVVQEGDRPVGLITLEDIVEKMVDRIQHGHPPEPVASLRDAIQQGGIILDLQAGTSSQAITELASAIPEGVIPPGNDI